MIRNSVIYFLGFLMFCIPAVMLSQSGCEDDTYLKRIGSTSSIERGLSLAYAAAEDVIYLAGFKDDSVSILSINMEDEVEWIRTFDIVPGQPDHIHKLIVDSEGMIVASGVAGPFNTLGVVFAFRYDPVNNSMIWANTYLSYTNCFNHGLEELFPGDAFLMSNNPAVPGNNDAQLIRLNRMTGEVMPDFSLHYELGDSDALNDIVLHNGFMYANGRFTDGPDFRDMRNTLIKIDPVTGTPVWTILGHIPGSSSARLYGAGMVIDQDEIFSISVGDENGTSINFTDIWMQKTNLDGEVQWMKKYDLPGTNDWIDEIISSEGGFILLARNRLPPSDIIMFKVDRDGNLLWAKKFDFSDEDNSQVAGGIQGSLRQIGNHIYFTAFAEQNGDADMVFVKTNLQGEMGDSCSFTSPIDIVVTTVNNPSFYHVDPTVFAFEPERRACFPQPVTGATPLIQEVCISNSLIFFEINTTICQGSQYEGYSQEGVYIDTFTSMAGCDSMRILNLTVSDILQSYSDIQICPGQVYEGYDQTGIYIDTFVTVSGCDSVRTLNLSVVFPEIYIDIEICSGSQFDGYFEAGMYMDTLPGGVGDCDTLRFLSLSVSPPFETSVSHTICKGEEYDGYTTSGLYIDTLTNEQGCDSIRTVNLQVVLPTESFIQADFCEGYKFGYQAAGTYVDSLTSYDGCDSIRTLYLEESVFYIPNVFSPNGDGLNDLFEIISSSGEGISFEYFGIFDRYGNMTYETKMWPVQWDGTGKSGSLYNPGVYTYVLKYDCQDEDLILTGDITLIR